MRRVKWTLLQVGLICAMIAGAAGQAILSGAWTPLAQGVGAALCPPPQAASGMLCQGGYCGAVPRLCTPPARRSSPNRPGRRASCAPRHVVRSCWSAAYLS